MPKRSETDVHANGHQPEDIHPSDPPTALRPVVADLATVLGTLKTKKKTTARDVPMRPRRRDEPREE
jgi:hypothetical protein